MDTVFAVGGFVLILSIVGLLFTGSGGTEGTKRAQTLFATPFLLMWVIGSVATVVVIPAWLILKWLL